MAGPIRGDHLRQSLLEIWLDISPVQSIKGVSVLSRCQYSSNSIISLLNIIEYRINNNFTSDYEKRHLVATWVSFRNGKSKRAVSWKGSNLSSRFYFIWYSRSPFTFSIGCCSLVSNTVQGSAITFCIVIISYHTIHQTIDRQQLMEFLIRSLEPQKTKNVKHANRISKIVLVILDIYL